MLTVTQDARQVLKEILANQSKDPEVGMRLVVQPQDKQFALLLDTEGQDDQLVEHEGSKVLLVAPNIAPLVEDMTLDVEKSEAGLNLTMKK